MDPQGRERSAIPKAMFLSPISFGSVCKTRNKINAILNLNGFLSCLLLEIINDFLVSWFPRQAKGKKDKCDT